ncbi:DUF4038 domain-containing protein [Paenibacillus montanisoli]|uniref:DUF4038 domain-containing protein n=1 Tax=Paenibacillus montanisoli TaxID=2081970 RepID=A0A328UAD0_9BACL|nr:DUF4038 domain-containing protein [Paenibacillus montanisoli]RAP77895.1 hypothetical protein DL346_05415 [Paenibacillus montanisoli]
MKTVTQNRVAEIVLSSVKSYQDPFNEVQVKAVFTEPNGNEKTVFGFWSGGNVWRIRYSSAQTGLHTYITTSSDPKNEALNEQTGTIEVTAYEGDNPLYKHGALRSSANKTHLEHVDGTPFFWLADTWWMSLTKRLAWPDDFQLLVNDRVKKGFTVVQLVAGLFPDMNPLDQRGANEAGLAWNDDFTRINPAYFDKADEKIGHLVESGLVPCIVGCWGYYLDYAGKEAITKHWDYLLARYGAYNVFWCMAGEALMPFYLSEAHHDPDKNAVYIEQIRQEWTELTRSIKSKDPFQRPITIHPTNYGHKMVDDPALLDLDMLQTGHSGFQDFDNTYEMIKTAVESKPRLPVINSEVCYEGLGATSFEDIQRYLFWSCVLSGACGHTYGANGIWQVNSKQQIYGASPHGGTWGNTTWEEAYQFKGSLHVGIGKKILDKYNWWEFEPHQEWIDHPGRKQVKPFAAGIAGQIRVIFLPFLGGCSWSGVKINGIEDGVKYEAFHIDPITGEEFELGEVTPEGSSWMSPKPRVFQDWILVLKRRA